MAQITKDEAYLIWKFLPTQDWDGLMQAVRNEAVWDELGSEEAEQLVKAVQEIQIENAAFPENLDNLFTVLNQWLQG